MSHHSVDYARMIRRCGYRLTPQRELVLDVICQSQGHSTFDEIYQHVHAAAPAIDKSTVYRTLDFLTEMSLIASSFIGGEHIYEISIGSLSHHHLVCSSCGEELELEHELLQPAFEVIEHTHGFQVDADHLILSGICRNCRHSGTVQTAPPS